MRRLLHAPHQIFPFLRFRVYSEQMKSPVFGLSEVQNIFGRTAGTVPFDGLFIMGIERDNNLWMRAHAGTRDGRKGSAPMGRNYFLMNLEIDKNILNKGPVHLKLSPFIDIGRITDP
jgi:hypothetical protein